MPDIVIHWLIDTCDCEVCGSSCAQGARVFVRGELAVELTPAACFGGDHYSVENVYDALLNNLGYTVEHA